RRHFAGRVYFRQAVPGDRLRLDVPSHRRRLAQADAALGTVLLRSGGAQRGDLAYAVDRLLGQFQAVRLRAADIRVCGSAIPIADALCGRAGASREIVETNATSPSTPSRFRASSPARG